MFLAITKSPEEGEQRNTLIGLVLEVILAEFFSKSKGEVTNGNIYWCYTWFITQIIGNKAQNDISNLRDSFFIKFQESLENFTSSWMDRDDFKDETEEDVEKFGKKCTTWIEHLQKLSRASLAVHRVNSRKCSNRRLTYFGEVTSLYDKYQALLEVKREGTELKLLQEEDNCS